MSVVKVKDFFKKYGMKDRVLEFSVSSATVELAAKALNTKPARIAKTLSFKIKDNVILIVMAGDARLVNSKYKNYFGEKARMLSYDEVEEKTGHEPGGVCPFAVNEGVLIYLDESLKRFSAIFPACGSSNSAIELTIEELEKYSNYQSWIDVTEIPEWRTKI